MGGNYGFRARYCCIVYDGWSQRWPKGACLSANYTNSNKTMDIRIEETSRVGQGFLASASARSLCRDTTSNFITEHSLLMQPSSWNSLNKAKRSLVEKKSKKKKKKKGVQPRSIIIPGFLRWCRVSTRMATILSGHFDNEDVAAKSFHVHHIAICLQDTVVSVNSQKINSRLHSDGLSVSKALRVYDQSRSPYLCCMDTYQSSLSLL